MPNTLSELHKSKWKDHIQKLVFAYNCTKYPAQDTHHIFYSLVDTQYFQETIYYNRFPRKRKPQRLHQQMEGTNERSLQNSIRAREE